MYPISSCGTTPKHDHGAGAVGVSTQGDDLSVVTACCADEVQHAQTWRITAFRDGRRSSADVLRKLCNLNQALNERYDTVASDAQGVTTVQPLKNLGTSLGTNSILVR